MTAADLGPDGSIGDAALERWADAACSAYLAGCGRLQSLRERSGLRLERRWAPLPAGARLGRPATVVVTASAPEVRPSSFTIAVRLRPLEGDGGSTVATTCVVQLEDPTTGEASWLGDEIRDELIAIEGAA